MKQQQSALEQMRERTKTVIDAREDEIRTLEDSRARLAERLEQLGAKMTIAGAAGNVEAYTEAAGEQAKVKAAQDATEMRLRVLREEPSISETEYRNLNALVRSEYLQHYNDRKERLKALLHEMQDIQGEEAAEINETDKALLAWQRDLYRRADVPENLRKAFSSMCENRLENREINGFLHRLFDSVEYGALMREHDE